MRRNAARTRKLPHSVLSRLHRFGCHEGGAALVIAAILFPVVIGGMGLGAETGYWYMTQRKLQHAADTSVHAAAVRQRAGDLEDSIYAAALYIATETGFSPPLGILEVNSPPTSGAFAGDSSAIEVLVEETRPRLFSAVVSSFFSDEPETEVTFRARAVAQVSGGSEACVLALSPTASGAASIGGSTSVSLENCDIASNSNATDSFLMGGSSSLSTPCVWAVGGSSTTAGLTLTRCGAVNEYALPTVDPYASVEEPAPTLAEVPCDGRKSIGQPLQSWREEPGHSYNGMPAMRFCDGLSVKGNVTFAPGLYIIEGGTFSVGGVDATLTGMDVTFYFTKGVGNTTKAGSLSLASQGVIDLAAPTTGPLAGIAFFGSRSEIGIKHSVAGGAGSVLQGALYTPASELSLGGGSGGMGGCTQVIASQITFAGGASLTRECNAGMLPIITNQTVTIVE